MEDIILEKKGANFFGFERIDSSGKRHRNFCIRGNGDLWLSNKGIYFSRWLPKMDIFIPLERIKKVEIGRSHNGRWVLFSIILKVFYEESNETRVFGITTGWKKSALEWKNKIERLIEAKNIT